VPISDKLAALLDEWATVTGREGHIVRSLGMAQDLGENLSTVAIFKIVRKHGAMIGLPELAAHDLRRTYAQLGFDAGVPITQVSKLLGHSSVETTQRYLNLDLDLEVTASDFVPFG
jgi:integrase/recombinase XerD